jgi:hypothetical protein
MTPQDDSTMSVLAHEHQLQIREPVCVYEFVVCFVCVCVLTATTSFYTRSQLAARLAQDESLRLSEASAVVTFCVKAAF